MEEEHVLPPDVLADLTGRLQEGLGLDVTDGAADLGDDDVGSVVLACLVGGKAHAALDLVSDVRDHLNGVPEVVAAAFLLDDRRVDLPGGHIVQTIEVLIQEALIVADVQVGLCTILGDEDLAVLEGVHRARIHVQIGIELLHDHGETPRAEQMPQR